MRITISGSEERIAIRDRILEVVRELTEEDQVPLELVLSELTLVASKLVEAANLDVSVAVVQTFGETRTKEEIVADEIDALETKLIRKWYKSAERIEFEKLDRKVNQYLQHGLFRDMHKERKNLIRLLPKMADAFRHIYNGQQLLSEDVSLNAVEVFLISLLNEQVVLGEREELVNLIMESRSILDFFPFMERDFLESLEKELLYQIDGMERICEFLQENPLFPQSKLYKQLGLNGNRLSNPIKLAIQLEVLRQEKHSTKGNLLSFPVLRG